MMASKGPPAAAAEDDSFGREVRSVVEPPRRSPAEREGAPPEKEEDWTWEAE